MKLFLAFTELPPAINGVGDHTALMARLLAARGHDVTVLCTGPRDLDPIEGVRIKQCMTRSQPAGALQLIATTRREQPDWLILQYASFAWGRYGLNPALVAVASGLGRTRFALAAHENYPDTGRALRRRALSAAQRRQLITLGRRADLLLLATEPWADMYAPWFPDTPIAHLPVASNLPVSARPKSRTRQTLGLKEDEVVVGVFGHLGSGRNEEVLRAGLEAAGNACPSVVALYVGPSPAAFNDIAAGRASRVITLDKPAPAEAADAVLSMDVCLAPFSGGVSRRRTTFLAALQHGIATVTTAGPLVGPLLTGAATAGVFALANGESAESFAAHVTLLVRDVEARAAMGSAARTFYENQLSAEMAAAELARALVGVSGDEP